MSPHHSPRPILIVDDEPDIAATCARLLRRAGHRVLTTGSRHGALLMLAVEPMRLLICDVRLPDGDGLDVVRAAQPWAVPAIVISGYVYSAARQDALAAGARAYLAKPFAVADFAALVEQILVGPRGTPSPQPTRAPEGTAPRPTVGAAIAFSRDDEILRAADRGPPLAPSALPDRTRALPSICRDHRGGGPL